MAIKTLKPVAAPINPVQIRGGRTWEHGGLFFAIVLAFGACLGVFELADRLSDAGLAFVFYYFLIAIGITIVLRKVGGRSYARLWIYALVVRLTVVAALSVFPPTGTVVSGGVYCLSSGVLFPDEAYYVIEARTALQGGLWSWIVFGDPYERIVAYYGAIMAIAGEELIWGRMVNALLTSFASLFIYDAVRRSTCLRIHKIAWWVSAFAPVLVIWSCTYLKEAIVVLGVAMLVNSAVALSQGARRFRYWWFIFIGMLLCGYVRWQVLILLLPILAVAFYMGGARKSGRPLFIVAFAGTVAAIVLISTSLHELAQLLGVGSAFFEKQMAIVDRGFVQFPFFDIVNGLPGLLRNVGFALLLLINPVITGVWNLFPIVGNPSWMVFTISAYAVTWWFCLPLCLITLWAAIRKRDGWWVLLAGVLLIWIFISAVMRFGAGYDAFRYREAYVPLTILLAMRGLHVIYAESTKPRQWWLLLKFYASVVLGLVVLRGVGILSM